MDTNTSDEKLFHKLINIQRNGKTSKLSQLTVDGKILVKPCDIAEGWATYFERLSKSLECPDFNEEYKQVVEADYDQILEYCSTDSQPGEFTTIEILAAITGQQKSSKSPDEQSLMAEHLTFGGPNVVYMLKQIFSQYLY
jgi:hypothetical protein